LAEDVFIRVIDCFELGVTDVAVTNCKLHVYLRLGGLAFGIAELGNKSRSVTPLAPRLGLSFCFLSSLFMSSFTSPIHPFAVSPSQL
jgi:hypothetical protein